MNASTAISPNPSTHSQGWFASGPAIVAAIAILKLALELCAAPHYGIFRDEMYYLACGQHLGWGYVDHPPLMPFIAWFASHIFGTSLIGLRLLPALAGAALVWLTGAMARMMGGARVAQALAAIAVLTAPIYMLMQHWLTMNAFEPLLWMACAWCVLRFIHAEDPRWWLLIGVLVGIGLEMKYSVALFAVGLIVGLALTPHRRVFASKWFWLGCLAACLIFLPHLVWLIHNHFPFLEYEHNIRMTTRDIRRGPVAFLLDQAFILNPVSALLWIGGLVWTLFTRAGSSYRILAWTFLVVLGVLMIAQGKNYYVSPVYPMMFAAGAVAFTQWIHNAWLRRSLHHTPGRVRRRPRAPVSAFVATRDLPPLPTRDWHHAHQSGKPAHRPASAVFCRRIRLGRHGPQNRRRLLEPASRGTRPHCDLRERLGRGCRHRLLRPEARPASRHQPEQFVLVLGTARLRRQHHDRSRQWRRGGSQILPDRHRLRSENRQPVVPRRRALHDMDLPRIALGSPRRLAKNQTLGMIHHHKGT